MPTILSSGKQAGTRRKTFSLVFNLRSDRLAKKALRFLTPAITANIKMIPLKEIIREFVDNGVL
jgi:hypothetical protein